VDGRGIYKYVRDLSWGIESSEDSDGHERKGGRNMSMSMGTALGDGIGMRACMIIALGLGHAGPHHVLASASELKGVACEKRLPELPKDIYIKRVEYPAQSLSATIKLGLQHTWGYIKPET